MAEAAAGGFPVEYLLLWVLPAVTLLQALLRLRAAPEHGAVPDPASGSPPTAARTCLPPPWLAWALFRRHANYRIERHLYPAVPHYNCPPATAPLPPTPSAPPRSARCARASGAFSRRRVDSRPRRAFGCRNPLYKKAFICSLRRIRSAVSMRPEAGHKVRLAVTNAAPYIDGAVAMRRRYTARASFSPRGGGEWRYGNPSRARSS